MKESNYDIMAQQAQALFLQYDQDAILEKFPLAHDAEAIYVPFLCRVHRLDRKTGRITDAGEPASSNAVMSIYDMLCYSKARPQLSGEWKTQGSLSRISTWGHQSASLLAQTAALFSGKTEALRQACKALGGVKGLAGDVSAIFPMFPFFPVCLQFWDGDEDFPPALQILWDANALDFVHYETLWYMSGFLCHAISEQLSGK